MKKVTWQSNDDRVVFLWTETEAKVILDNAPIRKWEKYRLPELESFDIVATQWIAKYEAIMDRLTGPANESFINIEMERIARNAVVQSND